VNSHNRSAGRNPVNPIKLFLLSIALSAGLGACGKKDETPQNIFRASQKIKKFTEQTTLTGLVSNQDGPLTAATIEVRSVQGQRIARTDLQADGRYSVEVPAGTALPVVISAHPEKNKTELMVAIIDPGLKKNDINPLTTAIAKKAKALGGYTYANMAQAAMSSTSVPRNNQTTGGFSGDPTRQYGGWH